MIDYVALTAAKCMPDRPGPGAKMSGGDLPLWDADMDYWLGESTVYINPYYVYMNDGYSSFEVSGEIEC